jgi:hypothetical protein
MVTTLMKPQAVAMTTDAKAWLSRTPVSLDNQQAEEMTVYQFQVVAPYIYTVIGIVGLMSNVAVAYILKTSTVLNKRLENRLLFHQSFIDGLTGLFLALNMTSDLITDYTGLLGFLACKFWVSSTLLWIALQASICNLVVITIDRYMEVVYKNVHRTCSAQVGTRASLFALPWAFAIASSLPFVLMKNSVVDRKCVYGGGWPSQWAMRLSITLNVCDKYVVPLLVYLFCYARMVIILKRNRDFIVCLVATQRSVSIYCVFNGQNTSSFYK